jgi:hypothetical protein
MRVPVVQVREMWVRVDEWRMTMVMGTRLRRVTFVPVPVALVVHVPMFVLQHIVLMRMLMPLGQMQPESDPPSARRQARASARAAPRGRGWRR